MPYFNTLEKRKTYLRDHSDVDQHWTLRINMATSLYTYDCGYHLRVLPTQVTDYVLVVLRDLLRNLWTAKNPNTQTGPLLWDLVEQIETTREKNPHSPATVNEATRQILKGCQKGLKKGDYLPEIVTVLKVLSQDLSGQWSYKQARTSWAIIDRDNSLRVIDEHLKRLQGQPKAIKQITNVLKKFDALQSTFSNACKKWETLRDEIKRKCEGKFPSTYASALTDLGHYMFLHDIKIRPEISDLQRKASQIRSALGHSKPITNMSPSMNQRYTQEKAWIHKRMEKIRKQFHKMLDILAQYGELCDQYPYVLKQLPETLRSHAPSKNRKQILTDFYRKNPFQTEIAFLEALREEVVAFGTPPADSPMHETVIPNEDEAEPVTVKVVSSSKATHNTSVELRTLHDSEEPTEPSVPDRIVTTIKISALDGSSFPCAWMNTSRSQNTDQTTRREPQNVELQQNREGGSLSLV